jgi:hypothetical protein
MFAAKNKAIKIVRVIILIASIFVFYQARIVNVEKSGRSYLANNLPITQVSKVNIGVNYYAELARSFLHGHTYLLGPYNSELFYSENPYGGEAYEKGIIIQDASFYEGRYYIYFGPLPAVFYVAGRVLMGGYPSDWLVGSVAVVLCLLMFLRLVAVIFNSVVVGDILRSSNGALKISTAVLALFTLIIANPIMVNYCLSSFYIHGISRLFAIYLFFFGFCEFYFKRDSRAYLIGVCLISLSVLCKYNFFVYGLIILVYFHFIVRNQAISGEASKYDAIKIFALAFYFLCFISLLQYNYVRFDNFFEFGLRYQTNSLDFVHTKGPLLISGRPGYIVSLLFQRAYEYVFSLPSFNSSNLLFVSTKNVLFSYPNSRFYTDGYYGLLWACPVVLALFWDKVNCNRKEVKIYKPEILLLLLVIIVFLMLMFAIMSTMLYTPELLLVISLLFVGYKIISLRRWLLINSMSLMTFVFVFAFH